MIVVIQGVLPHYREGLFNALCDLDDVVVVHSGKRLRKETDRFEEIILPLRKIGPFRLQTGLTKYLTLSKPDSVIAMFDIRWPLTVLAMFRFDKKLNWIWWGLGRGKSKIATFVKRIILLRQNPVVFYSRHSMSEFMSVRRKQGSFFVARNTLLVENRIRAYLTDSKTHFINVGSLLPRKRNDLLIESLHRIRLSGVSIPKLLLVGDGPERQKLESLVCRLQMNDIVVFSGFTNDPGDLANYYRHAIASVSFGQAGLAVLQSFAHGVPFITGAKAVSSGEVENIIDGKTGLICEHNPQGLESALKRFILEPEFSRKAGQAAYEFFSENTTVDHMVDEFRKALASGNI